jgi:hypothetical protein
MESVGRTEQLRDQYRHPGFYPSRAVKIAPWDDGARIIRLTRRSKKRFAEAVRLFTEDGTTAGYGECETSRVVTLESSSNWKSAE